jgi:hypothetical protein
LGFGLTLSHKPARFAIRADVLLTYAYLSSDTLPTTHLLRPGASLGLDMELPLSKNFLISLGWESALYVPQGLGSLNLVPWQEAALFHLGQAYLKLHFRFPYTTQL